MDDLSDHSTYLRTIVLDDFVTDASETECLQRGSLIRLRADTASKLCDS